MRVETARSLGAAGIGFGMLARFVLAAAFLLGLDLLQLRKLGGAARLAGSSAPAPLEAPLRLRRRIRHQPIPALLPRRRAPGFFMPS